MTTRISLALSLALASALPATVLAQTPDPQSPQARIARMLSESSGAWTPAQIANMERLRDAALTDPYALTELRHLTDNIGPRLAGSPQAQHAVEWVASEMRALGATVTIEKTTVPHWVRGEETAELTAWPGMTPKTTQKIVLTALGGSIATPKDGVDAPVVVVDSFAALKILPKDAVKGKILLFNEPFDKELAAQGHGDAAYGEAVVYRGAAPSIAASLGAVATLVRSAGGADYRMPHTGMTYYSPGLPKIPAAAVTAEDADLLKNLTAQGEVQMHLTLTPETLAPVETANVIADWKGTEHPEQVVIVSGHLDSWDLATGAIDDGAGIVVSMQAIHLLEKLGIHPQRTVRFVAWMDEEQGSYGAQTYAKDYAGDLQNHVGAIESDLGAGHPTGIYFQGGAALDEWLKPLSRVLAPIGAPLLERSAETGEDINSVTEKRVPGFAPIQDSRYYFNYHHTAADTFDKVNPRELGENAAVMAVTAYALADAAIPAPR
ncbi:MAG TPA: M20/M25/M40 family metallo-hydrolase [Acidobacteriaceae bacterium]|nr:M20/M25/M40 family metallo-hydrolase [Acidobacteriaceae bacterium]